MFIHQEFSLLQYFLIKNRFVHSYLILCLLTNIVNANKHKQRELSKINNEITPNEESEPLEQETKNILLILTWDLPLSYLVLTSKYMWKKTFCIPFLDPVKILVPYCVLFYYFLESNTKLKLIDKVYSRREVLFKIHVCLSDSIRIKLYVYVVALAVFLQKNNHLHLSYKIWVLLKIMNNTVGSESKLYTTLSRSYKLINYE